MKTKRMTLEAVIAFNPSPSNPLVLESDNRDFPDALKKISIQGLPMGADKLMPILDSYGQGKLLHPADLKHCPDPNPDQYETLYENMTSDGSMLFVTEDGRVPCFLNNCFNQLGKAYGKTGRTLQLNMTTWKVES